MESEKEVLVGFYLNYKLRFVCVCVGLALVVIGKLGLSKEKDKRRSEYMGISFFYAYEF